MVTLTKSHLILIAVLLILALLLGKFYLAEHDSRIKLEVSNQLLQKDRDEIKEQLAAKVSQVKEEAAKVKTPSDAVQYLNKYIPFPIPLTNPVDTTPSTLSDKLSSKPDAPIPAPLIIPPQDIITLTGTVERCNLCTLDLEAARADNIKLKQELDNANKTVKGGSWIRRTFRQTKVILCAGAGAAAGAGVGVKGAAIGAVGMGIACTLF